MVAIVKMQRYHLPCGIVVGEGGDVAVLVPQSIEDCSLSLLRHSLSEYRKYAIFGNR